MSEPAPSVQVPELSGRDVQQALVEAYRTTRHHHLFAFFGHGVEETIAVAGDEVRVVPVRSELELRERLPPLDDEAARLVFLVPWTSDIPLDLMGRFALNGRVRRVGKEARMKALFQVSEIDDAVVRSALAGWLMATGQRVGLSGSRLTIDGLWGVWLERVVGVEGAAGGVALDALAVFVAVDTRGAAFAETLARAEAGATRAEFVTWLGDKLGPAGPAVWQAWERGHGRRVIELAFVAEALAGSGDAIRMWLKTTTRERLGLGPEVDALAVAAALGREAASAGRMLERRVGAGELRGILRGADGLAVDPEVGAALGASTRLPSAWARRLEALGRALAVGVEALTVEAVQEAVAALRALEAHAFFKDEEQQTVLLRADMATRLLAWLVARPDRSAAYQPGMTAHADAEALGRWYTHEGGFVDRARHAARHVGEGAFSAGVAAVVARADAERRALDRRFSVGLQAWVQAGQPASEVVPIHDAVKRVAVKFLDGDARRRVLVLLMDGMAWTQASELLEALGRRAAPWGPLTWHWQKEGHKDARSGSGPLPVVFAALPTVTEVSRSAFFWGKPLGKADKTDTAKDPERWAANAAVKAHVPAGDAARLLLRADGQTAAGGASAEALSLIADARRPIVAMVLNAIDDSLKAGKELRPRWDVETIAALPDLLEKARESGRAVLLASDHGHVPAGQKHQPAATVGGARWRAGSAGALADNELAFTGTKVWSPPGADGVVLLTDDASRYVGSSHAGEHGGATLAEVVAPCVLIGCEDAVGAAADDAAQRPRAMVVPRWWHFDLAVPVVEPVVAEVATPPKKKPTPQLELPVIVAAPEPVVVGGAAAAGARTGFAASAVLEARAAAAFRPKVVVAVEALLAGGVMSADAFAAAIGMMAFRVPGHVAKLGEVLNLDGYEVIRFDPGTRQVSLDRDKLAQLFEVALS